MSQFSLHRGLEIQPTLAFSVVGEKLGAQQLREYLDVSPNADFGNKNEVLLLHRATRARLAPCVKYLLEEHQYNPDAVDNANWRPVHYAAQTGDTDILELLIAHGASVNAERFILVHAEPFSAESRHANRCAAISKPPVTEHSTSGPAQSLPPAAPLPIHVACRGGHAAAATALLRAGADANATDNQGLSPLLMAVLGGFSDVALAVIEAGAQLGSPRARGGRTAFHIAAEQGMVKVCEAMLTAANAPIVLACLKDDAGQRPLDVAVRGGHIDLVALLVPLLEQHDMLSEHSASLAFEAASAGAHRADTS
eukprot:g646.t1